MKIRKVTESNYIKEETSLKSISMKKILGIALSLAMILGILPMREVQVFAQTAVRATVGDKTLVGSVGDAFGRVETTITLDGASFTGLAENDDVTSWFRLKDGEKTIAEVGLQAKVEKLAPTGTPNILEVAFSAPKIAPTNRYAGELSIVIPSAKITGANEDLIVDKNPEFKMAINLWFMNAGQKKTKVAWSDEIEENNEFTLTLSESYSISFAANADLDADLSSIWFEDVPAGVQIKLKKAINEGGKSATFVISGSSKDLGVHYIQPKIPASALKEKPNLLEDFIQPPPEEIKNISIEVYPKLTVSGEGIIGEPGKALAHNQVKVTLEGDTFEAGTYDNWIQNAKNLGFTKQNIQLSAGNDFATIMMEGQANNEKNEEAVQLKIPKDAFVKYSKLPGASHRNVSNPDVKIKLKNYVPTLTDIKVMPVIVSEAKKAMPGTKVADLSVVGEPAMGITYRLEGNQHDNNMFQISGSELQLKSGELSTKSYTVTIVASEPAEPRNTLEKTIAFDLEVRAYAPTISDIKISPLEVEQTKKNVEGTDVADLSVMGVPTTGISYSLDGSFGDNDLFKIEGSKLKLNAGTNLEAKHYNVKITAKETANALNTYTKELAFKALLASSNGKKRSQNSSVIIKTQDTAGSKKTGGAVNADLKVSGEKLEANLSIGALTQLIRNSREIAKQGVEIKVAPKADVKELSLKMSQKAIQAINNAKAKEMRITSPLVNLTFDNKALSEIQAQAKTDLEFSIEKLGESKLHDAAKKLVESRPVLNITVRASKEETISKFGGGKVAVGIPYNKAQEEDANQLTVYHLSDEGLMTEVPGARYDAEKKAMLFETEHFSIYAVGKKQEMNENKQFVDIDGHWAKADIDYVLEKGFMYGLPEGRFAPDMSVTRGMFVTVLGRMAGVKDAKANDKFEDVSADMYYAPYIAWAEEKGIIKGMGENKFMPEAELTREQMATIIMTYVKEMNLKLADVRSEWNFEDETAFSDWAKGAIKSMQMAGILSGRDEKHFDAKGHSTRAELAKILHKLAELN